MNRNWKRNSAVAVMALLVCGAVSLNWRYTERQGEQAVEQASGKILGEATLVSDKTGEGDVSGDELTVYTGSDYFASARLTRQQARDSAIALLQEAAQQENASDAVADEASEGIQVLAAYTLQEAQIENLVTAKGYTDCVAFMGEDSLSVVVSKAEGELEAADIAKITDIAMTETGLSAANIRIVSTN